MHLDPDFECLTYGDEGGRRGAGMVDMGDGDLLVFYGGLRPVHRVRAQADLCPDGHVRRPGSGSGSRRAAGAVARERPRPQGQAGRDRHRGAGQAGRIGAVRPVHSHRGVANRAYRVRNDVLDAWGGLSVKDGFIQRSAVPPAFNNPRKFLSWLRKQGIGSWQGTTDMAKPDIFFVHLRRPKNSGDQRADPFYEFGSFGCTGCHSWNLLHPRNAHEAGGREAGVRPRRR